MTVIYLLIAMSPLSTLAMQSKRVAHAMTGECSGDCDICGCSVESRASHTCCCSKKHQKTQTVFKCGCPCGNNKLLALWGGFNYEILPCRFAAGIEPPAETRSSSDLTHRLTSRYGEPPDPPPRLSNIS
jgi:hypothetical protein